MTIQEAIKSGKRFRRKGGVSYVSIRKNNDNSRLVWADDGEEFLLWVDDILSTDWEVETIKKELSAEDIRKAIEDLNRDDDIDGYILPDVIDGLLKKLGLE